MQLHTSALRSDKIIDHRTVAVGQAAVMTAVPYRSLTVGNTGAQFLLWADLALRCSAAVYVLFSKM